MKDYDNIIDVIANEETELTDTLKKSGFRYDVLISESKYLYSTLNSGSVPYEYPVELLQLGIPFIEKKALNIDDFGKRNRILYWINNLFLL